jgi:hypothetical protein
MSIRTRIVKTEEVVANECNPRQDFGDIEGLAATFAVNAERPGEPFIPPLLVKDGDIYRIVDGERRFRAMQSIGTESFTATVASSFDDANSLVAMLATDDKLALTDIERSRGVQQMLLLGVAPDVAATAARIDKEKAYRVLAGRNKAKDKAEAFTLDRLFALAEFEDETAIKAIARAKEEKWADMVEKQRRRLAYEEFCGKWRELAEKSELPFVELDTSVYGHTRAYDRDDICVNVTHRLESEVSESLPEDVVALSLYPGNYKTNWNEPSFAVWTKCSKPKIRESAKERRARRDREAATERFERDCGRRSEFLKDRAVDPSGKLAHTCEAMSDNFGIDNLDWQLQEALELLGISEIPYVPSVIHVACAVCASSEKSVLDFVYSENSWYLDSALGFLEAIRGMIEDGYEPSEDERTLMATIAKAAEEQEQKEAREAGRDEEPHQEPEVDASDGKGLDAVA